MDNHAVRCYSKLRKFTKDNNTNDYIEIQPATEDLLPREEQEQKSAIAIPANLAYLPHEL